MWKNRLKPYDILSGEDVEAIHEQAMTILEEIGVDFLHDRAREIFGSAGMAVDGMRVRFDRGFVMEMAAKTPSTFTLQARNPMRTVTLGGDNMVTAPVYGPPFITDLERGRRGATIEDFNNFDKMAQAIDQIHCAGGTTVEPEDLPLGTRHLDMLYSHMRWTDKPFMGSVISAENARDTIEMASILLGGRDKIEEAPAVISLINVNSPLRYDDRMLGALLEYTDAGQPVIVTPFLMAGAMSPMGLAGTVAQQTAEALAGIVPHQYRYAVRQPRLWHARVGDGNSRKRSDGTPLPNTFPRRRCADILQIARCPGRIRIDDVHVADHPRWRPFRLARSRLARKRSARVL